MSRVYIGLEDLGKHFLGPDGEVYRCISYAEKPTATLLRLTYENVQDRTTKAVSGVVGSLIFDGFRRLRPED